MSQYKITKQRLAEIIKEEYEALMSQELEEGYMDALDRSRDEERRQKSYDYDARERERERNQRQGRTGGTRMGGSYKKERFPGFNRDDETADQREDHNIDDLYAMVRDLEAKVKDLKGKE
tara:strand:+ start:473 stop:832 length:360 start_codon:yes stop_codon:yes gene_type:complete